MERPIIYSQEMIKAYLEGRKTMTRRVIKPQKGVEYWAWSTFIKERCPYGQVGDKLWVRETWDYIFGDEGDYIIYKADAESEHWFNERKKEGSKITWKPSIHMPRRYSRLTQTITEIRVERLQDITPQDALAEGVQVWFDNHPKKSRDITLDEITSVPFFQVMWNEINAKRGYPWESNCWVWVISYPRYEGD